jgi:hypothetical protein
VAASAERYCGGELHFFSYSDTVSVANKTAPSQRADFKKLAIDLQISLRNIIFVKDIC